LRTLSRVMYGTVYVGFVVETDSCLKFEYGPLISYFIIRVNHGDVETKHGLTAFVPIRH
jgi:hypothetical protein